MKGREVDLLQSQGGVDAVDWTGERFLPELTGQIRYEHVHRYALGRELARDKAVLDLSCGEGYGAARLAETAAWVTGVDHDVAIVEHAGRRYASYSNLT